MVREGGISQSARDILKSKKWTINTHPLKPIPVSYTHLDVYKRQVIRITLVYDIC